MAIRRSLMVVEHTRIHKELEHRFISMPILLLREYEE